MSKETININGEKLLKAIHRTGRKPGPIMNCLKAIGKTNHSDSYLSNCIKKGSIESDAFYAIMDFCGFNPRDYIDNSITVKIDEDAFNKVKELNLDLEGVIEAYLSEHNTGDKSRKYTYTYLMPDEYKYIGAHFREYGFKNMGEMVCAIIEYFIHKDINGCSGFRDYLDDVARVCLPNKKGA